MAIIKKKTKVSGEIPSSALADIAFLLLFFFLTTTHFDEELGLRVVLPEAGPEAEVDVPPGNLMFFQIQPDGSVQIRRGESQSVQPATARQVEGIMRQALAANPNIIGVIQTSSQARYEDMINVLDGIQSAGATRYSLQLLQ